MKPLRVLPLAGGSFRLARNDFDVTRAARCDGDRPDNGKILRVQYLFSVTGS
jgi:hypothetical protein